MERKARDSSGIQRACGDPAGACYDEAPGPPRGKRVPAAEINQQQDQNATTKWLRKMYSTEGILQNYYIS
ncbi:hypothetical protein [Heyndrickxia acidicola]|uniref:Uncharacterized protein n=1 Tax=Heyndrickxia acidicola TaxID=209389 RepID=A0ABU6MFH3_9BACI|nr:hypothetical protein [Heyndrickxia acidicola]MED1203438.1 hypothetical protein [Heyndrickxia acidicola]